MILSVFDDFVGLTLTGFILLVFFNLYLVAFFEISVLKEVRILRYLNKNIMKIKVSK